MEKIGMLEKKIEEVAKDVKMLDKKVNEMDKDFATSSTEVKQIFKMLAEIKVDTKETKTEIMELKNKPAKKWEKAEWLVISVMITAVISFLIGKVI